MSNTRYDKPGGMRYPEPTCACGKYETCDECRPRSPLRKRQEGGDHYLNMGVQPWDVVDCWPREQRIGYYRGGALKYLMRMGTKDEAPQEIKKGTHYLEKLLEVLREEE